MDTVLRVCHHQVLLIDNWQALRSPISRLPSSLKAPASLQQMLRLPPPLSLNSFFVLRCLKSPHIQPKIAPTFACSSPGARPAAHVHALVPRLAPAHALLSPEGAPSEGLVLALPWLEHPLALSSFPRFRGAWGGLGMGGWGVGEPAQHPPEGSPACPSAPAPGTASSSLSMDLWGS